MNKVKNWLLDKVQNEQNDWLGKLVLIILYVLSLVYRSVVRCRNWAYDRKLLSVKFVDANVISVGNLTTGGTGKTPFVIWFANQLSRKYPTAVVSGGYQSRGSQLNDEGLEISLRTQQVVQVQESNRVAAAEKAIQELGSSSHQHQIILDDGFQHRRLHRDIDIILIDATNPFGGQHLIPRGLLREEISSLKRAHFAVLTRANLVSVEKREEIQRIAQSYHPSIGWAESFLRPTGWMSIDKRQLDLNHLKSKSLLAFSGIGNPAAFYETVQSSGFSVTETKSFGDHFHFTKDNLLDLNDIRMRCGCEAMVCTVKDLVKINQFDIDDIPVFAFLTDLEFHSGQHELNRMLGSVP